MSHLQQSKFLSRLTANSQHVLLYENAELQAKAKACVPLTDLLMRTQQRCSNHANRSDTQLFRDTLLLELLAWYRTFFSWFDAANCCVCNKRMQCIGYGVPTAEDLRYLANNVENYMCTSCGAKDRFPRYNDPGKLLETRRGRCGEYANCFTLICRALKYDTRYVADWTDHCWTEVYSEKQKKWLHSDTGENGFDKPLLYEKGWGKKLSYVIAFSKDEVQDVTWRYTENHKEVLKRRNLVSEGWLLHQTNRLSRQLQSSLGVFQREALTLRLISELSEFLLPRKAQEGELHGRITGDLAWREARGELGKTEVHKPIIWTPSEKEMNNGEFCLQYSASLDKYIRRSDGNTIIDRWTNGVFQAESIFYKREYDWDMAYLARIEGSVKSILSWKFDLSFTNLVILQATVSCPGTLFHNGDIEGKIVWKICGSDHCQILENGCVDYEVDLTGSKWCEFSVEISLGGGDYRNAQIARQFTKDVDSFPLCLRVFFGSAD